MSRFLAIAMLLPVLTGTGHAQSTGNVRELLECAAYFEVATNLPQRAGAPIVSENTRDNLRDLADFMLALVLTGAAKETSYGPFDVLREYRLKKRDFEIVARQSQQGAEAMVRERDGKCTEWGTTLNRARRMYDGTGQR